MGNVKRFFLVVAMGALAVATTSFGEGFNQNHGGFTTPYQSQFQNPYQYQPRPVNYGGGYGGGSGTIANGGGGGVSFNNNMGGYGSQMPFSQYGQNQLFNTSFQPYLNSAPWGQYSPSTCQSQWNQPWTTYGNSGYSNTMTSPYFGNQFQQPYNNFNSDVSSIYGNGIPGLGYNVDGLGTSGFYDYGLNSQNYGGMSPYLGYNDYTYGDYGLGLGYGDYSSPYDYSGGFAGSVGGYWGDVGIGGDLSAWWN